MSCQHLTKSNLFCSYILREIYHPDYQVLNITVLQMELTKKLCTFAWNVWDGRRPVHVRVTFAAQKSIELISYLGFGQMAIRETHNKIPVIA
jgi:hypothetical protein